MEDVVGTVTRELGERVAAGLGAGVRREAVVVDPGFGFGKRGEENFALLAGVGDVCGLGFPVMVGASRKGFLGGAVGDRVAATVAAHTAAVLGGAHVVRVHDVRAGVAGVRVGDAVLAG